MANITRCLGRIRRRWALRVLVCSLIAGALLPYAGNSETAPRVSSQTIREIDELAAAEYARQPVASMTVGIVTSDGLVWAKSYGDADVENKIAATPETVYRIGGMTMQFTALMLLQLVEHNVVKLTDPVDKYYPEINKVRGKFTDAPPPTLEQLALHTSGLASDPDLPIYALGPASQWEGILLDALPHTTYIARPASTFVYSGIGYSILAAALSRAAKQPYIDYVKEHIFKPLNMSHTEFALEENIAPLLAKGYVMTAGNTLDGAPALREQQGRGFKVPGGSVYTTAGDLARFIRFELGNGSPEVLGERTLMENYEHRIETRDFHYGRTMLGYGIGFQVMRGDGHPFIGHGGEIAGYHARGDFDVDSQTGIIVLRNVGGGGIHVFTLKLVGDCLHILKNSVNNQGKEKVSAPANSNPNLSERR